MRTPCTLLMCADSGLAALAVLPTMALLPSFFLPVSSSLARGEGDDSDVMNDALWRGDCEGEIPDSDLSRPGHVTDLSITAHHILVSSQARKGTRRCALPARRRYGSRFRSRSWSVESASWWCCVRHRPVCTLLLFTASCHSCFPKVQLVNSGSGITGMVSKLRLSQLNVFPL
jgi:hypothetical protein